MLKIDDKLVKAKDLWGTNGFLPKPDKSVLVFRLAKRAKKAEKKAVQGNRSFTFPALYFVNIDETEKENQQFSGLTSIRLFDREKHENNAIIYIPEDAPGFNNKGEMVVDLKHKGDLAFAIMHHNRCSTSPFKDNKEPWFYLVDEGKEAKTFVTERKKRLEAEALVLNGIDEGGMEEGRLRAIAASFNIHSTDIRDIDDIRRTLHGYAMNSPIKFMEKALSSNVSKRQLVQQAIDARVIKFKDQGKAWMGLDAKGKETHVICTAQLGADPFDRLIHEMTQINPDLFTELGRMVKIAVEGPEEAKEPKDAEPSWP